MLTAQSDTLHFEKLNKLVNGTYPVVVTTDIRSTKQFYTQWLNYKVVFESTWFLLLAPPGENSSLIAFMNEEHPSTPPSPKATKGEGMFLTIEVSSARQLHHALKTSGAVFSYELKDEPWGQRRFSLTDPNGIWIDIVEQIQPTEGWWDQYAVQ